MVSMFVRQVRKMISDFQSCNFRIPVSTKNDTNAKKSNIRGGSNVPTIYVFGQKYEKYHNFYLKNFHFLVVKFSVYLNRRVFVIDWMSGK